MSILMTRLEKLSEFTSRGDSIKARQIVVEMEAKELDSEFQKWVDDEFNLKGKGNVHISELLKIALETSVAPKNER